MPTGSKSIRRWLSKWLAVQAFLGLGVVCVAVYFATSVHLTSQQNAMLTQKIDVIRHLVAENAALGDSGFLRHKLSDFFYGRPDFSLILEIDGKKEIYGKNPGEGTGSHDRRVMFSLPSAQSEKRMTAQLVLDVSPYINLQQTLALALFVCALVGAMLVSLVGTLLVRRALAPVGELGRQAATLSPDRMSERLNGRGQAEEIQPLVGQFNAVLDRLENAYVQMEGFNADVAHELRNPLTTLIGETELALRLNYSGVQLREILGSNLEELHRMARIITDMLFLSQADRGVRLHGEFIESVAAAIMRVMEYYEEEAAESDVRFVLVGDAPAEIERTLLQQAVSNLISNALRYSDRSSEVTISISTHAGETVVEVSNMGKPIEEHHLPKLFQRFYRATDERTADGITHCGLGLSIVAAIAKMHGGRSFAKCIGPRTTIGFSIANTGRRSTIGGQPD
ncbi:heavy metal sensor histidine kinase [Paracandidimonas lactea]|uniref:heavy metal sensor histidine kinase n=1 Tax=Paracandidimonas lactea TaxID=2895524 RepID=UPI001F003A91|nr:heavy metal sensor histidine kinase [Paracandidimonas lactea]